MSKGQLLADIPGNSGFEIRQRARRDELLCIVNNNDHSLAVKNKAEIELLKLEIIELKKTINDLQAK